MVETLLDISDNDFEEKILQSDKPAIVDFWAPWCGPCKAIAPAVAELSEKFSNRVTFAKCNVDDNPLTPGKYGVQSIPTLIFIKDGDVAGKIIGLVNKARIEETLNTLL